MKSSLTKRLLVAAALSVVALLAAVSPAAAADATLDFPAGVACSFELRLVISSSDQRVIREFTDKNGNVVRVLSAGKGATLTFTNLSTGASLVVKTNGSNSKRTINADGTETVLATGYNVIILFPSDVPAGPSTTLYVGSVTYTIDTNGVFTITKTSGTTTDICAALTA